MNLRTAVLLLSTLLASCVSVDYDLGDVPFPVSAKPAPADAVTESFEAKESYFLYVHGLFGEKVPDVTQMLAEAAEGSEAVHDFRVTLRSGFSHWLLTHLTLGFVRTRTVVAEGTSVRPH